jgi:iron complex transport system substrate-binding protein
MRLVSLCPSNTELVAYLGATDMLVGVDNYSDWPSPVTTLPRLGPDLSIDMEKVASLKPDLVLASLSVPGMEKNIAALERYGIPYVIFNPSTLSDISNDLQTLGKLIGKEEAATTITQRISRLVESYSDPSPSQRPTIYWEWWPKPIFTPGAGNWLTEISHLAGGINGFWDDPRASVQTTWEDVLQRDPDHICLVWVGVDPAKVKKEFVLKRPEIETLTAFKNNSIHILPEPFFCRPSPRLYTGLMIIHHLLNKKESLPSPISDPILGF